MSGDTEKPGRAENGQTETHPLWERRTYTFALFLMALGTLGSSWCGYQASLWDGRQTFGLMDASTLGREANQKSIVANQQRSLDAALFVEYARNISAGKTRLNEFFLDRMRPDFRDALKAWTDTRPLKNPAAPATPFVMPQYRVQADIESKELYGRSQALYDQARKANMTSDIYTLLTVLYTTGLFLAGLVSGFHDRRMRRMVLIFSVIVLLLASAMLMRLPVASLG
jgi:hypothetical protein